MKNIFLIQAVILAFAITSCMGDLGPRGNPQEDDPAGFNLELALKDKKFEEFYRLMSRTTHNIYEFNLGIADYKSYENADINLVKELLPFIPHNALNVYFGFRDGMGQTVFSIADFIIRKVEGSNEEKIALLKKLHERGLSFDMIYFHDYVEGDFLLKNEGHPEAKSYISLLEKNLDLYGEIIDFLKQQI